jgi:nucleoid DNA-binding protein
MPDCLPSVDEDGVVTEQKMVDHMMRCAKITRNQALTVVNCYYQTIQHNLIVNGQAKLKDLLTLTLVAEPAKPQKSIKTCTGVQRNYKPKEPTVKVRPILSESLVKAVISEKDLSTTQAEEEKVISEI